MSLQKGSTGIKGLDDILHGLILGDNVVWQVDSIDDYREFVSAFARQALLEKKRLVYIRFALHPALFPKDSGVKTYELDASEGFEPFSARIHNIAKEEGEGVYYVFDSLSDLLSSWATDLMVGNFFRVTCPYLYELKTIAYFALLRNSHSFKTVARIRETTQLLLDLFKIKNRFYVHPLKVFNRYSPTMFLPHVFVQGKYVPVTTSADAAKVLSYIYKKGAESESRKLDHWDRLFIEGRQQLESGSPSELTGTVEKMCGVMIGREEKMLELARRYFTAEDLLAIKDRMIGSGYIGGKAVGMLLSRKILQTDPSFDWAEALEEHDSFYVGSDVFYTYIVQNGWWRLLMEQKTREKYLEAAPELGEKLLGGEFPIEIKEQFQRIIEYFGQAPIIVRSSSLLEDSFGNVFAGKYESIFCANQGTPEQRYKAFESAVKKVFASTMNRDALFYRLQKGLSQKEEQMALLVQRVSGKARKQYFFPDVAGVGISYNTFVWKDGMDPKAGMIRIVAGLGTRAVNRVEDDHPRIAGLDEPLLKPTAGLEDDRKWSQRKLDVIDTQKNSLETVYLSDLLKEGVEMKMELLGQMDALALEQVKKLGQDYMPYVLTFEPLFSGTKFSQIMQGLMKRLEKEYGHPVDIEFAANFGGQEIPQINLLQCRPLQTKGEKSKIEIPEKLDTSKLVFSSRGSFMGGNVSKTIKRIVYVDAVAYSGLDQSAKYDIARLIGKLNQLIEGREISPTILIGPGRWGTSTPSMGIPVGFSEINMASALVEVSFRTANLVPEVSFGTHFFQDLVETDIFYIALFTEREEVFLNEELLNSMKNNLPGLLPEYKKYENVVKVCNFPAGDLTLMSDIVTQRVVCFRG